MCDTIYPVDEIKNVLYPVFVRHNVKKPSFSVHMLREWQIKAAMSICSLTAGCEA